MYEALETMAANTVQPPRFSPAMCPSQAPRNPWNNGIRIPKATRNGPTLRRSLSRSPETSPISSRKMQSAPRKIIPLL